MEKMHDIWLSSYCHPESIILEIFRIYHFASVFITRSVLKK